MSAFEPKNRAHAISAAAFQINFVQQLDNAAIERAKAIEPTVKDFLPGFSVFPELPPAVLAVLQRRPLPLISGVTFQRVNPDGSPAWLLTAQQNFISAQCTDYSRWHEVWGRTRLWLRELYSVIKTPELELASVTLQYIDQFTATLPLDEGALEKLFQKNTQYLPMRVFNGENLWHVNQGWYQNVNDSIVEKKLNVLNTSTQITNSQIVLSIDHQIRCELTDKNPPLFDQVTESTTLLDQLMGKLHDENKAILGNVLSGAMAQRIHLND